jgi:hypothetical protein
VKELPDLVPPVEGRDAYVAAAIWAIVVAALAGLVTLRF